MVLTAKGSNSINRISVAHPKGQIQVEVGHSVHQKCRRDFCRPRKPKSNRSEEQTISKNEAIGRHSVKPRFSDKDHCFFCSQPAKYDGKKRGFDVIPVRTQDLQYSIAHVCKERNEWSGTVLGRLEYAHAADAVYHQAGSVNFRTGKQVPQKYKTDGNEGRAGVYGPTVTFEKDVVAKLKKDKFLANKANKQRFINHIGDRLQRSGCTVIHATGNADLLIVQTAIQSARSVPTVLVGDDTDLLVLLCYHTEMDVHDLFSKPEPKQMSKKRRFWDIKKTKSSLGLSACTNILFVHAFLGCDTTSRLHGIGKGVALKKLATDLLFYEQAEAFNRPAATKEEIVLAGEKALLCLYNSKSPTENLNSLWYTRFCQKVATRTTFVQPESLPPMSAAAAYHSQRVYFPNTAVKRNTADA